MVKQVTTTQPEGTMTQATVVSALALGRKGVEAFVQGLKPEEVLPFLALATQPKKDFDYAVKLAEARVMAEGLIELREWQDKHGAKHRAGEWMDANGVLHTWAGEIGDLFVADPAALRAELEMEDVPLKELDDAFERVWKVNFTNLQNIENMYLRLMDLKRASDAQKANAKRVVEVIRSHRERKPDGPAHLKEKD